MSKVKVSAFGISIDGYSAGPKQDLQHPLGVRGDEIFRWFFPTETFVRMQGKSGGARGIDNDIAREGLSDKGAWILGRNMFGPIRGPWPDEAWKGWWGEEPPYHVPVFVLTHHPRAPIPMKGGTTFHFVTDGIESALNQAKAASGGKDVRIGGGVSTVRQYVTAGLVDEIHLALSNVILGEGENLFAGLDFSKLGFKVTKSIRGENATHIFLTK